MPVIRKQTPTSTPTNRSSVWDRVESVKQVDSGGIRMSLYGRSKTGKTRFISTFPKPILIIGAEDGTRSIRSVDGVQFVLIENSREVSELADGAVAKGFKTVAVDTASALQDMVLAEILGLKELPAQAHWGMASREQYGQCTMQMKTLLRAVLDLPCNVVITAHERNFSDEGASSDLIMPVVGSALSPSTVNWLNGRADYICQTFIRDRVEIKTTTIGQGPKAKTIETRQKTGKAEYCMRVGAHPVYHTGFRLPTGYVLPDDITDPHYDKVMQIINGEWEG